MSLIKKIKQFINGSWKEFNLSSDTLDNVVILDGNQNITGVKTFGNVVTIGKNTSFTANSILPPIETSLIDSTGIYVANTTQHTDITGNLIRIGSGVHPCGRIYLQAGSSIPGVPNLSISTDSDAYSSSAKFIGTTWGTAENVRQTTTTLLMPSDGTTGTIATQEWVKENVTNTDFNLENGEGIDSIVQKYTGVEDSTHFGNKDYLLDEEGNPVKDKNGEILYGESAAIFGEANSNNANRALLAGKLNNNSGANAIVGGLRNTVKAHHGITIGSVNTVEASAIRSVTAGYNNINSGEDSIQTGTSNENYGIGSAEFGSQNINRGNYSALIGSGLRNEQQNEYGIYNNKHVVGKWNEDKLENIFEVGNGTSTKRSNAFEVLRDGRAKVYGAPTEDYDVVRYQDVTTNLINGEGTDSIVQKYSGKVDATHFGNKDYVLDDSGEPIKDASGNILYGESAAIFGEANENNANRALLAGKLNKNSGANTIVGGLRNTVKANHGITSGSVNTIEESAIRSVTAGYNNINSGEDSIQTGTSNENYGIGSAEFGSQNINRGNYSALIGSVNINRGNYSALIGVRLRNEQQNEDGTYNTKVIVGKWNEDKLENVFEVGNGTSNAERSNAFEVLRDGRAKVKTAPKEDDDVVRKLELDGKISISDINQAFFNSLYN